jgi:hypothetical protein
MTKPSTTNTAIVIATLGVLATPAMAGGKHQPHHNPARVAKIDKPPAAAKIKHAPAATVEPSAKVSKVEATTTVEAIPTSDVAVDTAPPSDTIKLVEGYELGLKQPALGAGYDVLAPGRRAALPGEAELVIVPRSLTQIQVGAVVKANRDEVEYCWQQLAVLDRVPSTAVLKFKIDPEGAVTTVKIGGDAPAIVNSCIAETAAHWTFPEAETRTELAYPIALRSL